MKTLARFVLGFALATLSATPVVIALLGALTASPAQGADYFTEWFNTSANDTAYQTFTFTPDASASSYAVTCDMNSQVWGGFPTDPSGGTPLDLTDDSYVAVALSGGARVALYGTSYASFYVGSNGYVTFGSGDTTAAPSLAAHFSKPRIAALFDDLNPAAGGTCSSKILSDRAAVTFQNVPKSGSFGWNSFQIEMFFDGRIRITILVLSASDGLIGLSRGTGVPADFVASDFSSYGPSLPMILSPPASLTTQAGRAVTFGVHAVGTGQIDYRWRHNGVDVDLPLAAYSDYTIDPVQAQDAGSYDVRVTNGGGSVISAAAVLTVSADTLADGSFEAGLAGWTATGNVGIANLAAAPYVPTDGSQLIAFNSGNSVPNGVLTQAFATDPRQLYVLEFDVGVLAYNKNEQRLQVSVTGSTPLISDTVSIVGLGGGATRWVAKRYAFVADGSITTLTFSDLSPATLNEDLVLDHVRITPQPPSNLMVTTLADENDGTLGQGSGDSLREVLAVPGAKVIHFAPALHGGTILLGGTQLTLVADTTIDASALANGITVSGNHASRVFEITNQAVVEMKGLVIAAGTTAGDGAGILNGDNCHLTLINSTLRGNTSAGSGGGISNAGGWLTLTNCTLTDNHAGSGGGILNGGDLTVLGCALSGNRADTDGGAISIEVFAPTNISGSQISNNISGGVGGGILNAGGSLWMTNTTVAGNSAAQSGGGIYSDPKPHYDTPNNLYVTNSTFAGNTAGEEGGAIFTAFTLDARNLTISGNSAAVAGGGVAGGWVALTDSIVAGNSAGTDPNISGSSIQNNGHNLIDVDPLLAPLGDYGGPTQTMPPLPGSPAIDAAGNPTDAPATDQRGLPRISGPAMDIGAVEIQPIGAAPVIVKSPSSLTTQAGRSVTFRVEATGTGPLVYHWHHNQDDIPSAGSSEYTIDPVQADSAGTYDVVVSNAAGSAASAAATLTVSSEILANGSFEEGLTAWTLTGNGSIDTATGLYPPTDGTHLVVFNSGQTTPNGVLFQAFTTVAGQSYTLAFDAGVVAYNKNPQTLRVTVTGIGSLLSQTITINGPGGGATRWVPQSFTFVANSATSTLTFRDESASTSNLDLLLDNVRIAPPILVNGSFEADLTGWTASGNVGIADPTGAPYVPTDGSKIIAFNAGQSTPNGVLSQAFATVAGQTYSLAFDAGVIAYNKNPQTLRVTVTGTGSLLSQTITINGLGGGAARWVPQSFTFMANSATSTLTFRDQSASTNNIDLLLDHVRVTAVVTVAALPAPPNDQIPSAPVAAVTSPATQSQPVTIGTPELACTPAAFTISLTASEPGSYVLERSQDLQTWEYVSEMQIAGPGPIEFQDPKDSSAGGTPKDRMFYRIGRRP